MRDFAYYENEPKQSNFMETIFIIIAIIIYVIFVIVSVKNNGGF